MLELELPADILGQPAGDLHPADVFADRVVRASFGDQHPVARRAECSMAIAPCTCAVRSPLKRDIRIEKLVSGTDRGVSAATFRNACESVTTSFGGALEPLQRAAQFALLYHQAIGIVVQQVADRLHLGQDQPPLGRFLVNRHHQHGHFARTDQVAEDGRIAQ